MRISYRNLKPSDLESIRNLQSEIWPDYGLPEHRWSIDDMHRCFPIMGAFHNNSLIAALCAMPMDSGFYWIHFIYVHKSYQNKCIGTKLVELLITKLSGKALGIQLEIKTDDSRISKFYTRLGFSKISGSDYIDSWNEQYTLIEKKFP